MIDLKSIRGYLDDLKKARDNNTLAVFVGAGITKTSETVNIKIPLWVDLINDLKRELDDCDESDFLKIAELYYLKHKGERYYYKIKSAVPQNLTPSNVHKLILELNPQVIITTNWDDLLEKAIDENGYFYDTIACDDELGKSSLPKKLIKMHGDFSHARFVFKESDYVNYKDNFPLIENYVKSILSSSTVLFLGYSFSDFNLKQILGWINNRTSSMPSLYIILDKKNEWKQKYLESHGLIPIIVENNELEIFLKGIQLNVDYGDERPEDFILSKLKYLEPLKYIFYKDIESAIKDSRIEVYNDGIVLLHLPKNNAKYVDFLDKLKTMEEKPSASKNLELLNRLFSIFLRSGITGIAYETTQNRRVKYFKINGSFNNEWIERYFDFDFLSASECTNIEPFRQLELMMINYNLRDYKSSYEALKNSIASFQKQKDFLWAFISMFNNNNLVSIIESNLNNSNKFTKYNLSEKISNLSYDWRKKVEPISNIVNFSIFYKQIVYVSNLYFDREKNVYHITKGGSSIYSFPENYKYWHKSLLNFVINNFLMVEDYSEFILPIELMLRTTIIRSITTKEIRFNKCELFSLIKYFDSKKVAFLLKDCFTSSDSAEYRKFKFEDVNDKKWLKRVLKNLCNLYAHNSLESKQITERYIQNTLFVLSIIELDDTDISDIHNSIFPMIENNHVTLSIIEGITSFMLNQNNLNSKMYPTDKMLQILTTFLRKFASGNVNCYEHYAIENNYFYFIFNSLQDKTVEKFSDSVLLENVIAKIESMKEEKNDNKSRFILYFFFPLYSIASSEAKSIIRKFVLSHKAKLDYYDIQIKLYSIIYFESSKITEKKYEIEKIIEQIEKIIKRKENSFIFDIARALMHLQALIKNEKEMSVLAENLKTLIEKIKILFEKMKFPSQI